MIIKMIVFVCIMRFVVNGFLQILQRQRVLQLRQLQPVQVRLQPPVVLVRVHQVQHQQVQVRQQRYNYEKSN